MQGLDKDWIKPLTVEDFRKMEQLHQEYLQSNECKISDEQSMKRYDALLETSQVKTLQNTLTAQICTKC